MGLRPGAGGAARRGSAPGRSGRRVVAGGGHRGGSARISVDSQARGGVHGDQRAGHHRRRGRQGQGIVLRPVRGAGVAEQRVRLGEVNRVLLGRVPEPGVGRLGAVQLLGQRADVLHRAAGAGEVANGGQGAGVDGGRQRGRAGRAGAGLPTGLRGDAGCLTRGAVVLADHGVPAEHPGRHPPVRGLSGPPRGGGEPPVRVGLVAAAVPDDRHQARDPGGRCRGCGRSPSFRSPRRARGGPAGAARHQLQAGDGGAVARGADPLDVDAEGLGDVGRLHVRDAGPGAGVERVPGQDGELHALALGAGGLAVDAGPRAEAALGELPLRIEDLLDDRVVLLQEQPAAVPGPAKAGDEDLDTLALRAWTGLDGLTDELITSEVLRGAGTNTLKAIEESAKRQTEFAADVLSRRRHSCPPRGWARQDPKGLDCEDEDPRWVH